MASIYDTNFQDLYQKYRNKQRLAGGQIDPGVVGALAEADLNARYTDQKSRRAQDLQEKAINNSYDIANRQMANSMALADRQTKAQKQAGMYSALASLPTLALTGYKLGKESGLWGVDSIPTSGISLYDFDSMPSYDFISPTGLTGDVDLGNWTTDYSNYDWNALQGGGSGGEDTSWLQTIMNWIF